MLLVVCKQKKIGSAYITELKNNSYIHSMNKLYKAYMPILYALILSLIFLYVNYIQIIFQIFLMETYFQK